MNYNDLTRHIPSTSEFISIDQNKCNKCENCILVCIANLWRKIDNACYQVCEADAIEFRYPSGGTGIIYEKG